MTSLRPLPDTAPHTAFLAVAGMTCGACVRHVHKALVALDGVRSADVNLARREARVVYDASLVKPEHLVRAVSGAGYDAAQLPE